MNAPDAEALSVVADGAVIVARVRGEPTVALLERCQQQVVALARASGRACVLYDALAMAAPPVDVPWAQRELDDALDREHGSAPGGLRLRRAIVVPDSKLAYLARLAFGAGDYRVFYGDLAQARRWLEASVAPPDPA
jgi:hypothetical protein